MEISTSDMLQAGANYSAALAENRTIHEHEIKISVWDWQKYFESAKEVLSTRTETKGDTVYTSCLAVNDEIKELSQKLLVQLMKLATDNLQKVTSIYN